MKNQNQTSRRGLLGGLVATVGGVIIPGRVSIAAEGDVYGERRDGEGRSYIPIDVSSGYAVLDKKNSRYFFTGDLTQEKEFCVRVCAPNVVVDGMGYSANCFLEGHGLSVVYTDQVDTTVINLNINISGETTVGIRGEGADRAKITRNIVNGGMGMDLAGNEVEAEKNRFNYSLFRGLALVGNKNRAVDNNFYRTHYASLHLKGEENQAISNYFTGSDSEAGIKIDGIRNTALDNTIVSTPLGFDVRGAHNKLIGNKIYSSGIAGIESDSVSNIIIDSHCTEIGSLTHKSTCKPTILGRDGNPISDALVMVYGYDDRGLEKRLAAAITDDEGKIGEVVTTHVLQDNIRTNLTPLGVVIDYQGKVYPFVLGTMSDTLRLI